MLPIQDSLCIIVVVAIVTFFTRAFPFLVFKKTQQVPHRILYLGRVLPMAIMFCLVLYCIRNTAFLAYPYGIPEIISIASVVCLHVYKRNVMVSILGGTLLYMILLQVVFV